MLKKNRTISVDVIEVDMNMCRLTSATPLDLLSSEESFSPYNVHLSQD